MAARRLVALGLGLGLVVVPVLPGTALAQNEPVTATRLSGHPQRDTLTRLMRPITIDFQEQRLEDVLKFIKEVSGADIKPLWIDDRNPDGLDPEDLVTLSVEEVSMLELLDQVLLQISTDFEQATWQMTNRGTMQISTKARLNRFKRIEIYDISDLLLVLPTYDEVPEIDLDSVLQSSQGGGGQSPFDDEDDEELEIIPLEDRANEVRDLIVELAEPQAWIDNGGDAASIRYWQGALIIQAPDYVHRAVNGYPWWPSRPAGQGRALPGGGARYVSMTVETSIATIEGFAEQEVTAIAGGELVSSNPGGGG